MATSVRSIADISVPGASRTNGHVDRETQDNSPGSRMTYSRLIGALFLAGFLFYGVGAALVTSVTGAPDFLSTISAHQTTLFIGAFLMLLNTTLVEVGKGVLFFLESVVLPRERQQSIRGGGHQRSACLRLRGSGQRRDLLSSRLRKVIE